MLSIKAPLFIAAVLAANAASAAPTTEGPNGGSFDYYGHLNFSGISFDDGQETTGVFADNGGSTSRIGFNIFQPMGDANTFRFRFESNLGFASTPGFDNDPATDDPTWDWRKTNLRIVDFIFGGDWGTLSIGQGSTASDGVASGDLSGTFLSGVSVSIPDPVGGFIFRRTTGDLSGIRIGDTFTPFDGNGRKGRIRYDSPEVSGFKFSLSYGEEILRDGADETFQDVALRYRGELGDGAILEAAIAYFEEDRSGTEADGVSGSVSLLLESGLNFTLAAGQKGDPSYVYGKVGYITTDLVQGEKTAFAVDYFDGSDYALAGGATRSSSSSWGIGVVQTWSDLSVEAYLGYRSYSYDDNVADYFDMGSWTLGARWSF